MPAACPSCQHRLERGERRYCSRCGHDLTRAPGPGRDPLDGLVGQTVEGRYRVVERIGAGGMGVVYRVEHVRMGKVAAMKVLRRDLADDAAAAKRFRREVETVSRLDHPNIVQTFDFGEWHGLLYLVMEYIRGQDLAAILRREGPLPPARALPLFVQVCAALEEAHHHGIIHRDLKPDNIVCIARRGQGESIKVLDFGLAKLMSHSSVADVTGAGSLIGTPYYMAPEQVRSEPADARTDLYALGATMYRLLTGTPVFHAETPMAILTRHLHDAPEPPGARAPQLRLSSELDAVILRCLAKDREERFATAGELKAALEAVLAAPGGGIAPEPDTAAPGDEPAGAVADPGAAGAAASASLPSWIDNPVRFSSAEEALPRATSSETVAPGDRLRREDVDAFEAGLRWKKRLLGVALLAVVAGSGWGAYWLWHRAEGRAGVTEREPNDSAATANRLASGEPIYGIIGPPRADGSPDHDYFVVRAGRAPRSLLVELSAVAGLDLVLELFDGTGKLVQRADEGREGAGETLGPLDIERGEHFLRVRAVWVEGQPHVTSDSPYRLLATW